MKPTFNDYDEERKLIDSFGGNNVSWMGGEWAVRFHRKTWRVERGAVTKYGIRELKKAMQQRAEEVSP